MATESRVDVNHSHPFWARPFPDVTVVHNGHVTNYYKNRRLFEMRGHRFQTGNDTEFVAVYLADRMAAGVPLDEAVRRLDRRPGRLVHLPGVDRRGLRRRARPLLAPSPAWWPRPTTGWRCVSEGIALAEAFGDGADFDTYELRGGEARAWTTLARPRGRARPQHPRDQRALRELLDGGAGDGGRAAPGLAAQPGGGHARPPRRGVRFRGDVGYFCGGLSRRAGRCRRRQRRLVAGRRHDGRQDRGRAETAAARPAPRCAAGWWSSRATRAPGRRSPARAARW